MLNSTVGSAVSLPVLLLQGACFYKNNTDGTFDFWRKERTLAFSRANCYCYALNRFEGEPDSGCCQYHDALCWHAMLPTWCSAGGL